MSVRPMEVRRERALEVTLESEELPWTVEIWGPLAVVSRVYFGEGKFANP